MWLYVNSFRARACVCVCVLIWSRLKQHARYNNEKNNIIVVDLYIKLIF